MENQVNTEIEKKEVVVTDIKMPFFSMVVFMVKWVIASIPAFIILFILFTLGTFILGGLLSGFSSVHSSSQF
jgi:hypothetical protein